MSDASACPHCGGEVHWRAVGQPVPGASMVFTITPGKHGVILVRNFGQIVEQFGKFVEALSREAGLGERAFISGLSFTKAGGVKLTITLVKMRRASRSSPPVTARNASTPILSTPTKGHQQRSAT